MTQDINALRALRDAVKAGTGDIAAWHMCAYLEPDRRCQKCPHTYEDPKYGTCVRGCRAIAEETIEQALEAILAQQGAGKGE